MIEMDDECSAWVMPLAWDGAQWSYAWGSFQCDGWSRRGEPSRALALLDRATLLQRLLRRHDKVVAVADDASLMIYRRLQALDCIVIDVQPPLSQSRSH